MRSHPALLGLALALGALAAACGDDGEAAGSGGSGAGTTGEGSGGEAHAYVDLPKRSGTVTVFESHVEGVRETNLIGAFLDIEDGFPGACAEEPVGPCTVTYCKSGSVSRDSLVDAGSLTLRFGEEIAPVVVERNTATGFYLATIVDDELLTTGLDVTVETSGSRVPSFASAMPSPPTATLTSPLPAEFGRIPSTSPLDLAWTSDGDEGELVFVLRAIAPHDNIVAECVFEVAAGAAQVPAEAIAQVASLQAIQSVSLEVETRVRSTVAPDDFAVSLALVVTALSGDLDAIRAIEGFD